MNAQTQQHTPGRLRRNIVESALGYRRIRAAFAQARYNPEGVAFCRNEVRRRLVALRQLRLSKATGAQA